jgi:hypothetical protein
MASGIMHVLHRFHDAVIRNQKLGLLATCVLIININSVHAEDAYLCKLFAREYLRIVYAHNLKALGNPSLSAQQKELADTTADTTKLPFYYKKVTATCLASAKVPDLPDVQEATDDAWLADLVGNHMSRAIDRPSVSSQQQDISLEKSVSPLSSEQSKAQATCDKVHMKVSWTNNGRSWRCIR